MRWRYPAVMASVQSRILFIGNSFVARHDVPGLVASLAATAGHRLQPTAITAGGASLRRHLNSGAIAEAVRTGFDIVVLQEQSTLPIRNASRYHDNVRDVLASMADAVPPRGRGHAPRILLYETWARQSAPASQATLSAAVAAIGAECGLEIAPVGQAWQRALVGADPVVLHDRDGSHPTLAGAFLAAGVLAMTIFPADLDRITVPDDNRLDPAVASRLLAAARGLMRQRADP